MTGADSASTSAAAAAGTMPPVQVTRGAMSLLTLIYTLNFVDRQIINILAESIKVELALSDAQLGLLTGFSFALFYTVLGLPIARLADRSSRTAIISIAVFAWSFMTCLCGLAQSFVQMLLARVGVAVGESGCTPAAHSLISDWFPPQRRASALAMYSLGVPLGTLFGMALGGWIGHGLGWRVAFFVAGVPGMLLAAIAWWMLKEPARRERPLPADQQSSMLSVLAELSRSKALWCIAISMSLLSLLGYGQAAFLGSFYLRVHELPLDRLGVALGLMLGLGGVAGVWTGGVIADRSGRGDPAAFVLLPAIGTLLAWPFAVGAFLVAQVWLSLGLLAVATALNSLWLGPAFAAIQMIVRPDRRAMAVAAVTLVLTLIGLGCGPVLIGLISDAMAASVTAGEALRFSLLCTTPLGAVAAGILLCARKPIRQELVYA